MDIKRTEKGHGLKRSRFSAVYGTNFVPILFRLWSDFVHDLKWFRFGAVYGADFVPILSLCCWIGFFMVSTGPDLVPYMVPILSIKRPCCSAVRALYEYRKTRVRCAANPAEKYCVCQILIIGVSSFLIRDCCTFVSDMPDLKKQCQIKMKVSDCCWTENYLRLKIWAEKSSGIRFCCQCFIVTNKMACADRLHPVRVS